MPRHFNTLSIPTRVDEVLRSIPACDGSRGMASPARACYSQGTLGTLARGINRAGRPSLSSSDS
jgi:hypothetical protein